ncbi:MAG: hypothetical protein NC299_13710 [Lachnospiraceae bacterium]|nr:hypothetical protein [Ruminococcus sp.]MCM1276391.1 hypothetical protein [Lachnospiraceae bacterium]
MDFTAIIVAVLSLIGTLGGSLGGIVVSSKLTAYRIQQLENKVAEHNNFARRMPVLEEQIDNLGRRIDDLEEFHKPH